VFSFGVRLNSIHVLHGLRIKTDYIAGLNELGTITSTPFSSLASLKVLSCCRRIGGSCFGDFHLQRIGEKLA
jgi:hypothetical protein